MTAASAKAWRAAICMLAAVILFAPVASRAEDKPDAQHLISEWKKENTLCRGLHGDDPRMPPACERRQHIGRALYERGWCYGEKDQMTYQMRWHKCRANSLQAE